MKHFLLDIEGTTVPISFVHDVLFPFARERLSKFLETYNFELSEFTEIKHEFEKDINVGSEEFLKLFSKTVSLTKNDIPKYLIYLIDMDRKFGPLKKIQGKIWKDGYEKGLLKSTLFEDVPTFLQRAKDSNNICYVYSSGSVEAQILIYKYSNFGDQTNFFKEYFDTAMGGKKDTQSYKNIAHHLNVKTEDIVFFTDIVDEGFAAANAGIEAIILDRPGNTKQPDHNFKVLKDLLSFF
ncbi:MAG: acireductone synthase [Leptospira sp.]|nr:acireductone synthase [Leptospira sp.]